jgi:hypothetical protein
MKKFCSGIWDEKILIQDLGSGMEKILIWDKHPRSTTLVKIRYFLFIFLRLQEKFLRLQAKFLRLQAKKGGVATEIREKRECAEFIGGGGGPRKGTARKGACAHDGGEGGHCGRAEGKGIF